MSEKAYSKAYLYRRIVEAKLFIDRNYTQSIDVHAIANEACFSKYHFLRLFKKAYGKTPHQYLTSLRINEAKKQLSAPGVSVAQVCFALGFESQPSFTQLFKRRVGVTPRKFAQEQAERLQQQKAEPLTYVPSCFCRSVWLEEIAIFDKKSASILNTFTEYQLIKPLWLVSYHMRASMF